MVYIDELHKKIPLSSWRDFYYNKLYLYQPENVTIVGIFTKCSHYYIVFALGLHKLAIDLGKELSENLEVK